MSLSEALKRYHYRRDNFGDVVDLINKTEDLEGFILENIGEFYFYDEISAAFLDRVKNINVLLSASIENQGEDSDFTKELLKRMAGIKDSNFVQDFIEIWNVGDYRALVTMLESCGPEDAKALLFEAFYTAGHKCEGCDDDICRDNGYEHISIENFIDCFFSRLVEKADNLDGCYIAAIGRQCDVPLEELLKKTTNFEGCLLVTLGGSYSPETFDFLFERTTNFGGCLMEALRSGAEPEHLERLFAKTTDFGGCLEQAVEGCLRVALSNPRGYQESFLSELLDRTPDGYNLLLIAVRKGNVPVGFAGKLLEQAQDVGTALKNSFGNKEITPKMTEVIFAKTTNFEGCLESALRHGKGLELVERLFAKTTDFTGCFKAALEGGSYPVELCEKLLPENVDGCLALAIKKGYPTKFLDVLLEKGGKIIGLPPSPEYKKYYLFHDNAECFICLLDFEEGAGDTTTLGCGHKVHTACNLYAFKCPYH